jgi:hypothetical protein
MKKNLHLKNCLLLAAFLIFSLSGFTQSVGISDPGALPPAGAPNAAAGLDVNFANKGLLIPRVVLVSTANSAPLAANVAGMIVYNAAPNVNVTPGFYFNDGTKWVALVPKANTAGDMQYWNGTIWITIPAGQSGQRLQINASGLPVWAP